MSTTLTTNGDAANVLPITTDKRGLAARYLVGIRTIEVWNRDGVIIGSWGALDGAVIMLIKTMP